ncbi:MAG: hypothetical protein JSW58_09255 [Candidatus Latescibacterota bacterium]|nr:MAG: hypothetical protein JSW58_09255 [Candidatus Latescibacterota bacterium]
MNRHIVAIMFTVCLAAVMPINGTSQAMDLPATATYLFYIQGQYAGKSDFEITQADDILIFKSKSTIKFEDYSQDLTCRTEIDKTTLRPRFFEYKGQHGDESVSGTVWIEGDSISGHTEVSGDQFPSSGRFKDPTYLFQNYVAEHQIVIAQAIDASKDPFLRFHVLLPSDFMTLPAVAALESEIEMALDPKPVVCKKYVVSMQNSSAYLIYYDPNRKMPVYLDFPSVMTEVFLENAYGGKPVAKYEPPKEPE